MEPFFMRCTKAVRGQHVAEVGTFLVLEVAERYCCS